MNPHKMNLIFLALAIASASCGGNDSDNSESPTTPSNPGSGSTDTPSTEVVTVTSGTLSDVNADKAVYLPGETVNFTTASAFPTGAKVRYRQGSNVIGEESLSGTSWSWNPPTTDYQGYMADVYTTDGTTETILATIAVDVSSDWTMFPRYGFVGDFDASKTADVIANEMAYLSRCHINGIQFYDWHNKHHWPLGGTRTELYEKYKDIANRDVYNSVVKAYIAEQHRLGMKCMFYNLCFGVLDDAASDGVKEEWAIYKNANRGDRDVCALASSWKSSIYLVDPGNAEWQSYLAERNDEVYAHLDFDGYHIDQLGSRGDVYDYNGNKVNLPKAYASFLTAMKGAHPDKSLVMNSVASFGASQIGGSGLTDFCYNEVWGDEDQFADLHTIIKANDQYTNYSKRTMLAAYMNYDIADRTTGNMNTPGVLLTDAVIMALGGAHLELGDHMLSREYFPANPLKMTDELKSAIVHYYDFMTAYQNLLRGNVSTADEYTPDIVSATSGINICSWPPKAGNLVTYARRAGQKQVIHFLNFRNIDNLSWRDLEASRRAPLVAKDVKMTINSDKTVSKVWAASPDYHGGVPVELAFSQAGNSVTVTVPWVNYWTMLVME